MWKGLESLPKDKFVSLVEKLATKKGIELTKNPAQEKQDIATELEQLRQQIKQVAKETSYKKLADLCECSTTTLNNFVLGKITEPSYRNVVKFKIGLAKYEESQRF